MKINRNNCEAIFLDYYEKNLIPVEVAEVLFFLEENPDLKEVFESYEAIFLEHEKINFPNKEALRKKYNSEELDKILSSEITRANCEQFFIANTEGILSFSQKQKLDLFLLQYPELKKELGLFQQCRLSAEKISFEGKDLLKKELVTRENREEYFVRAIENDLSEWERDALTIFLTKHTEFKKEFELFSKTILAPETIVFENKFSLKKREKKPVFVAIFYQRTTYYAAAAAILFLMGLFFVLNINNNSQTYIADKAAPVNNGTLNKKQENIGNTVTPNEEKAVTRINNGSGNAIPVVTSASGSAARQIVNKKPSAPQPETEPIKNKQFNPVVSESIEEEKLIAQTEKPEPQMMKEEEVTNFVNRNNEEKKKGQEVIAPEVMASVNTDDGYQSLGAFIGKKIRGAIGIRDTSSCQSEEKLGWWDLAIVAKQGVQKLIGAKAVDVNKICDGNGDKVEYVFVAGNFEISTNVFLRDKSASR